MQGMMWLYASNVIFLEKTDSCARHVLEDFDLKTNFKGHAETGLLILFSSLGCVVLPPMVSSNFLGGCPNHAQTMGKSGKKHMHIMHTWMISMRCDWVDMDHETHGPPLVCFFHWFLRILGRDCKKKNRDNKNKVNEGPWVAGTCVVFFIFLGLSLEVEVWPASACVVCDQKNFVFFNKVICRKIALPQYPVLFKNRPMGY